MPRQKVWSDSLLISLVAKYKSIYAIGIQIYRFPPSGQQYVTIKTHIKRLNLQTDHFRNPLI